MQHHEILDDAQAELDAKRAQHSASSTVSSLTEAAAKSLENRLQSLRSKGSWSCIVHDPEGRDPILGEPPAVRVCPACEQAYRKIEAEKVEASKPRAVVLDEAGVPLKFCRPFNVKRIQCDWKSRKGWPQIGPTCLSRWTGQTVRSCLLTGETGAGKSALAAEMLWNLRQSGQRRCFWVSTGALVREEKETALGKPRPLMTDARTAQALVLDEVGYGEQGPWGAEIVYGLVEQRWSEGLRTIYTTHLKPKDFQEWNEAIADRTGDGLVVNLSGHSQRGRR